MPASARKRIRSRAKCVKFVVRQGGGVGECLPNVVLVQVRQFGNDLRRRHAVCDEVDNVGDRDTKTSDCRLASQ